MIYQIQKDSQGNDTAVTIVGEDISIPFFPGNTDYENFKVQINNEIAQLETADGVLMTPEEAKAYVATLP